MKKKYWILVVSLIVVTAMLDAAVAGEVPQRINYQARLVDATNPVNAIVNLQLRIYTNATGGSCLYEDSNSVQVVDGLYSTYLGDDTTYGSLSNALSSGQAYLEVVVNGTPLTPREPIASVSYALITDRVKPGGVKTEMIADGAVTQTKLADTYAPGSPTLAKIALLEWYDVNKIQLVGITAGHTCFDGQSIWTDDGHKYRASDMREIDGPYGTVIDTVMCFDGFNIWAADGNDVNKVKASDGQLLNTTTLKSPSAACYDGSNVWVACSSEDEVVTLRASDGQILSTNAVGDYPCDVCCDGSNIWVANRGSNTVTRLRASDGQNLGTYTVGTSPYGLCFDGANVWVANKNGDSVTKLRASDGYEHGTYPVGNLPKDVCYDGFNIWVANSGTNTVMKLRPSDGQILNTYTVGTYPDNLCFDGVHMWVDAGGALHKL